MDDSTIIRTDKHGYRWMLCTNFGCYDPNVEWRKPFHGNWIKIWCDLHDCRPGKCALEHFCKGEHSVFFKQNAFKCTRCGYAGKLCIPEIPARFQHAIKRAEDSGKPIEMCSVDGLWLRGKYCVLFQLLGKWKYLPTDIQLQYPSARTTSRRVR